jgi:hypothetical protein
MIEAVCHGNAECKNPLHEEHLCYMVSQGFNLSDKQEYDSLIENPQFKCTHCKRAANNDKNLCGPDKL